MIDIHWDPRYEVGHPRIDHEHQVFVELIRSVSVQSQKKTEPERMARLLQEVKKYAEFHFFSEENIMIDAHFPEFEKHHKEHQVLLFQLEDRIHQVKNGVLKPNDVAEFMFHWFAIHTTQEDKKISDFLQRAGE